MSLLLSAYYLIITLQLVIKKEQNNLALVWLMPLVILVIKYIKGDDDLEEEEAQDTS